MIITYPIYCMLIDKSRYLVSFLISLHEYYNIHFDLTSALFAITLVSIQNLMRELE